jgi:hypothetical protein
VHKTNNNIGTCLSSELGLTCVRSRWVAGSRLERGPIVRERACCAHRSVLAPIRRFVPLIGGQDLFLVLFLLIQMVRYVLIPDMFDLLRS